MTNYRILGDSIQGAYHIRNDKPCQDALLKKKCGEIVIAAVADGHGSENCPYSAEGAEAAVTTVWEVFSNIINENTSEQIFNTLSANKEIWLPRQIENIWKKKIRQIHSQKELGTDLENFYFLYGTTILAVVAAETFIFALQLGDGDILSIDKDGEIRWLIEPDYIEGAETYSLCLKNCWEDIKTTILPLDNTRIAPDMIMLCTDGYANSFASVEGFLKAGTDIHRLLIEKGEEYVDSQMREWLNSSSHNGSGDDITLALIFKSTDEEL